MHIPFSTKVLRDDRYEALQAAQDSTVDHDGPRGWLVGVRHLVSRAVLQVEALWKLEIELYGRTLERSAEGVPDGDIDLGSVECSIAGVYLPFAWVLLIKRFGELLGAQGGERTARNVKKKGKYTSSAAFQVSMVPR